MSRKTDSRVVRNDPIQNRRNVEDMDYRLVDLETPNATSLNITSSTTFTDDDLPMQLFFIDTNGLSLNLNPSGTFHLGYKVKIFNIGSGTVVFDSNGVAASITTGNSVEYYYDSINATWRQ